MGEGATQARSVDSDPCGFGGISQEPLVGLLHHFGSAQAVTQAAVDDLAQVNGISRHLAETVYGYFHDND